MRAKLNKTSRILLALAIGLAGTLTGGVGAQAADIEPSSLSTRGGVNVQGGGSIRGFLGEWSLTVELPDQEPMHLLLNFLDVGGKLGATVQAPEQTQAQVVTDITESSLALKLRYAGHVGETETGMTLIVRQLDSGTLTGSLSDDLGLIGSADVTTEMETRGLGKFSARVKGMRGGKIPGRTVMDLGGSEVKITYGGIRTMSDDFKRLGKIESGSVFQYSGSRATKLFTDTDLAFGDTIVRAGNAAEGYPGIYSLWLKKTDEGWSLVFNDEADIWGTMHDPDADVAEIALTVGEAEKKVKKFAIELSESVDGGVLEIAWGDSTWSAPFSSAGTAPAVASVE